MANFEFSKSTIAPVVSIVCLAVGAVTGHPIGTGLQEEIVTWTIAIGGSVFGIWGVFKNHKKKPALVQTEQPVQPAQEAPKPITPIAQFNNLTPTPAQPEQPVQPSTPVQTEAPVQPVQPTQTEGNGGK
jgi:hypothetical protein